MSLAFYESARIILQAAHARLFINFGLPFHASLRYFSYKSRGSAFITRIRRVRALTQFFRCIARDRAVDSIAHTRVILLSPVRYRCCHTRAERVSRSCLHLKRKRNERNAGQNERNGFPRWGNGAESRHHRQTIIARILFLSLPPLSLSLSFCLVRAM